MKNFNKVIDEYMCYDIDSDNCSEDSFIISLRNKDDDVIKKVGVYEKVRNMFKMCFFLNII
jgi:hypothetical protein